MPNNSFKIMQNRDLIKPGSNPYTCNFLVLDEPFFLATLKRRIIIKLDFGSYGYKMNRHPQELI